MDPRHLVVRAVTRVGALRDQIRRIERLEIVAFDCRTENTNSLLHLSILLIVPVLVVVVTLISNSVSMLSFLLFPPLAPGPYTPFSNPKGRYVSSVKFVIALTIGVLYGLVVAGFAGWACGPTGTTPVHPLATALAIFLTDAMTWALSMEASSAFSTALLTFVASNANPEEYVVSIFFASVVIAIAFIVRREQFYECRAKYPYGTVRGDDHVLAPTRGKTATQTAFFAARLAAAHSVGKVVLLDVFPAMPANESDTTPDTMVDGELGADADASVECLESCAHNLRTQLDIPMEIAIARSGLLTVATEAAASTSSDPVVTPYKEDRGLLLDYIRGLLGGSYGTVALHSTGETYRWRRVLVPAACLGDAAHAIIDLAARFAREMRSMSVMTCISSEVERRPAELKLASLVETADGNIETRVTRSEVMVFIASDIAFYDLVVLDSSGDRPFTSWSISPPTFEHIREVDCGMTILDRGH